MKTVRIEGHILEANEEEFINEFILWLESKGWEFAGVTEDDTEEEEEYFTEVMGPEEEK